MTGPRGYRRQDVALIAERSRSLGGERGTAELGRFLPLNDDAYAALAALAPTEEEASAQGATGAALEALVELGLLECTAGPGGPTYRVTGLGEAVLFVESGRRQRSFDAPSMPTLEMLVRSRRSVA